MASMLEPKGIPTIFGEVLEKNVTFCIDTSGSMYKGIEMVKEHLLETLIKMANSGKPYLFNIIEFNSVVTQWSDKLVTCTPQTVSVAKDWINKLGAKTGTNTKVALLTALNDPLCDAVYLVTDGLPDHHPCEILDHVGNVGRMRPIHCVYLCTDDSTEGGAIEFLEDLSIESYGSFHIVHLTTHGCLERITPIYRAEHAQERVIRTINGTIRPNLKTCSVATTLQVDPDETVRLAPRVTGFRPPQMCYPQWGPYWADWLSLPFRYYYPYAWSRYRPARGWIKAQEQMLESIETSGLSPAAGSLLINKNVLSRRIDDGYFYQGVVKSQLVYYYPYAWSRYRPARGWIKAQEQMLESIETSGLSPAAGSLLINKNVLSRRIDDGYFYQGVVKSQIKTKVKENDKEKEILSDKFLVAFGPSKHGKFTETSYQDTHVYDIIDYDDARRHTILTGDRVLAPWEPEGDRYGPGVVIEGHEKRQADGPDDKQITVSFTNGKVEKIPSNIAVWIPKKVYERIALEIKMPKEAREALTTEERYPKESLEGYPTSGAEALPEEYETANPLYFGYDPMVVERRPWRYPLDPPPYPLILKTPYSRPDNQEEREQEVKQVVPGTDLTQQQLDERIATQLMEHKQLLDEKETEKGTKKQENDVEEVTKKTETISLTNGYVRNETVELEKDVGTLDSELERRLAERRRQLEEQWMREQEEIQKELEQEKLLKKREKQEENTLKKSVTFEGEETPTAQKTEEESTEVRTTSRLSSRRTPRQSLEEEDLDTYFSDPEESMSTRHERGVNTESALLYPPNSRLVCRRPPWKKYWRADPGMPVTSSSHGPFRETAMQAPFEARNQRQSQFISEWTSPVYKFVDPFAKHDYTNSVEKLLKGPQPPPSAPVYRTGHKSIRRPMSADSKEIARRDFKRRKEAQRQKAWEMRMRTFDHMNELMQDQHREKIQAQIQREKDRQYQEQRTIEQSRESKKLISKEMRERIEANQKRELDKEEQRIRAMQRRREHREAIQREREQQAEEIKQKREEVKQQRSQERWDAVQRRLDQEDVEHERRNVQLQNAKINRINHFQQLEEEGQRLKDVRMGVTDRHLSMFQSTVIG